MFLCCLRPTATARIGVRDGQISPLHVGDRPLPSLAEYTEEPRLHDANIPLRADAAGSRSAARVDGDGRHERVPSMQPEICAAVTPARTGRRACSSDRISIPSPAREPLTASSAWFCAVTLIELLAGRRLRFGIEMVGFSEEEGVRFGSVHRKPGADRRTRRVCWPPRCEGHLLREAIRAFGLDPARIAEAQA